TRWVKWTALVVVENAPNGRAIPEHNLSRFVRAARFARHRPTRCVQGAVRAVPAQIAPYPGLGRRHCGVVCLARLSCLRAFGWGWWLRGRGGTTVLQHATVRWRAIPALSGAS